MFITFHEMCLMTELLFAVFPSECSRASLNGAIQLLKLGRLLTEDKVF